ncbi:MAG: putative reductase, partial [Candidatus Peribacteria bacterium]|nr:putative reductase [Candidatus Peribacteria bacterium]
GNNRREETWHAMEEILKAGKAKAIGVSNYTVEHLEEMQTYAHTMPEVNQIEFHPFWFRKELMNYCHERNIAVEDYSPLARAKNLSDPVIGAIAQAHGKTAAQVMLRWAVQHGNSVIPKSIHKDRIRENIDIFDFELSDDEMEQLNNLNENRSAL